MRHATLVLLLAAVTACQSAGALVVEVPGPVDPNTVFIDFSNGFRDPVDVYVFCGSGRVEKERWVMPHSDAWIPVSAGVGCAFRVVVVPSMGGGPLTERRGYDSGRHLSDIRRCTVLRLKVDALLAGAYTMPYQIAGCR